MPKRWTGMAGPIHIFVARLVYRFGKGEGERPSPRAMGGAAFKADRICNPFAVASASYRCI
jgi:hypothetical protein